MPDLCCCSRIHACSHHSHPQKTASAHLGALLWYWSRSPADQFTFLFPVNGNLEMTSQFFWVPGKQLQAEKLLNLLCQTAFESRLPCWCLFGVWEAALSTYFSSCGTWPSFLFLLLLSPQRENPLRCAKRIKAFIWPLLNNHRDLMKKVNSFDCLNPTLQFLEKPWFCLYTCTWLFIKLCSKICWKSSPWMNRKRFCLINCMVN